MERQTDWYDLNMTFSVRFMSEMCCFYLAKKNAYSEQICASADKSENTYYMMYILIYKWYGDDGGLQQHTCIGTIYEVGPMVCYMFIINFLRKKVQA